MLMLRLQRVGRRNEAHFKIVVIEKTKGPKSHKYIDIVGSYNPKLGSIQLDEEKITKWIDNGVQPSDTVRNMLITKGIIEGKKRNVLPHKSPVVDEEKIALEKEELEEKIVAEETEVETITETVKEETSVVEKSSKSKEEASIENVKEEIIDEIKKEVIEESVPEGETEVEIKKEDE